MVLRRPESVLILIHDQDQHILTLQRQDDTSFWQSVTGSLEPNEKPIQAAHREVAEETGVSIAGLGLTLVDLQHTIQYEIRPQWRYRYPPDVTVNTEHWFALQVPRNTPITLTEHVAYEWLSQQQAIDKMWSSSNRDIITHYFS